MLFFWNILIIFDKKNVIYSLQNMALLYIGRLFINPR